MPGGPDGDGEKSSSSRGVAAPRLDRRRWDVGDVPAKDWDTFANTQRPAPSSKASPPMSDDERSRGETKTGG